MGKDLLGNVICEETEEILDLAKQVFDAEILPRRAEYDEKEIFPHDIFDKFREAGLFGMLFTEEKWGGMAPSLQAVGKLCELMAKYCLGVSTSFFASKLGALPIQVGGTIEQQEKYLNLFSSGEKLAGFGLSEPNAGSDVPNLSTVAVKKGDRYILNGTKQWITNAGVADIYTVFASTNKARGPRGMTCFILEKGMPGFSFGALENKLGIRCSHTRQLIMEDAEVPAENVVGLKENVGFIHALKTLNASRPYVASMACGLARGAYEEALKYTRDREQFGKKVISFQVVQHMLADMAIKVDSAQMLTERSLAALNVGHSELPKYSAMAKCYSSEIAMEVATDALQLHGGYGFTKDYPVEKMFRDAKILSIYEGTTQIQKNEIGFYLIKESKRY